jgi:hypothetical protein
MHENGHGMQNPGDLRVPRGVEVVPRKKALIVGTAAVLAVREDFDEVCPLFRDGFRPTAEDEKEELKLTTRQ